MKRARSPLALIPSLADWKLLHNSVLALLPSDELVRRSCVRVAEGSSVLKVAAFDMDDTLITPKNGAVFPQDDPTDWKWLLPVVPRYLRLLYDEGFMVVIVSNQAGIGGKKWNEKKADSNKRKIIALMEALDMPLVALIATKEDVWRKPNVNMWTLLQEHAASAVMGQLKVANALAGSVIYVGDAAGRKITTLAGRKKDFSCSDRKFALNINVPFLTPEQFYNFPEAELLDEEPKGEKGIGKLVSRRLLRLADEPCEVDWGGVGPSELRDLPSSYDNLKINRILADGTQDILQIPSPASFHHTKQEMVIFVGYPGCGKTTFFNRFFGPAGYVHINRDTLKTKDKCLSETKKWWNAGKSVVIDKTNPSHGDCMEFINILKKPDPTQTPLPVRIFVFQASKALSMHMSNLRAKLGIAPRIGRIVYNLFQSKYEAWTPNSVKSVGIEELLEIPLVASFDGLSEDVQEEFFLLS